MTTPKAVPLERHRGERIGWLRAAVLGANDGIVSTASLVVGVAAAEATRHQVLVAGVAGLVAGALSMAAGEYVSVSSQADTQRADLALERRELAARPLQAALASAATFSIGAGLPVLTILIGRGARVSLVVWIVALLCLAALGAIAGRAGGGRAAVGSARVAFWGALAM